MSTPLDDLSLGEARAARDVLIELYVPLDYPWHRTDDVFHKFLAEFLLRRTTRVVVARVLPALIQKYPTAESLARAGDDELLTLLRPVGLPTRILALSEAARLIVRDGMPSSRDGFLTLPQVGEYVADAMLLYGYDMAVLPVDRNAWRVLYRMLLGRDEVAVPPRSEERAFRHLLTTLVADLSPRQTRAFHGSILRVAWETCRRRPICDACPVSDSCRYGAKMVPHSGPSVPPGSPAGEQL
ncbi:endonuclease III domain-containing protein [Deinococcus sp.]|uniref:endonuclease III domain-containing protein n=1 Tax=Deinococcus sp. TaxID=47478 RepID=UPI003C7B6FE2